MRRARAGHAATRLDDGRIVIIGGVRDPDLDAALANQIDDIEDIARAAVALDVLTARHRVVATLQRHGAAVVESELGEFSARIVAAYLKAKSLVRF